MSDEKNTPAPKGAKRYAFKGGAKELRHPFFKGMSLTADHLNGPKGERFLKALKTLDEQDVKSGKIKSIADGWIAKHIEEVK